MSKKVIIIICVLVALALAAAAGFFIFSNNGKTTTFNTSNVNTTQNSTSNTNSNSNNASNASSSGGTTESTANLPENTIQNTENNYKSRTDYSTDSNWQSPTYDPNSVDPAYAAEMNRRAEAERQAYRDAHPDSGAGSATAYNTSGDREKLASIDQEAYKNTAAQCIQNLLTYNSTTINTSEYRFSFANYISPSDQTSKIIAEKLDSGFTSNAATYSRLYSKVDSVTPSRVYVSHLQHDGLVAVDCNVIIRKNQGYPGEVGWDVVNLCEESYLVYFDDGGKVVDMAIATSKVLQGDLYHEAPVGTR